MDLKWPLCHGNTSPSKIAEHVQRLGELYPPISLDSVDRTIKRPGVVARKFGHVIDYLARVELEVDRNVLELLVLLPDVDETNKTFYADVWQPQEIQHGLILDRLQQDLGRTGAEPHLEVSFKIKILGALAHLKPIQDIAKFMYFLTGASTERQAVLAYNQINRGMQELGRDRDLGNDHHAHQAAGAGTLRLLPDVCDGDDSGQGAQALAVVPDPGNARGHTTWSAPTEMKQYKADMGGVIIDLGLDSDLEGYAREVGRVENRLLWAHKQGMEFPPYILKALKESVDLYRERLERGLKFA